MIDFQGARLASYRHQHNYFGDNFRYGVTKSITIDGSIYQLDNESGVAPVWSGISGIVSGATDYDDIIINGNNFGKGRVESLSFAPGVDVKKKDYSASITIFSTGNLFNFSGKYYSGLNLNDPSCPIYLTENFNEDFSFDLDENKEWNFVHNISVKFVSGKAIGGTQSPTDMARSLAFNLFNTVIPFEIFDSSYEGGVYNPSGKAYYIESYDEITSECNFSKRINIGKGVDGYSITYSHSINTDENGITTVSEDGDIKGIIEPLMDSANNGYSLESLNFYTRCNDAFNFYKPNSANLLSATRIRSRKTVNNFEGSIQYGVLFTNDAKIASSYSWEYTQEISKLDNCIYSVGERGQIKGISTDCSSTDLYTNALIGWAAVKPGIPSRVSQYYTLATTYSNTLKNISREENRSQFNGTIGYNYSYNDDALSDISGFKKINYSVEDSAPVHLVSKYNIVGVKELVQPQQNSTVGNRTVLLEINGYKGTALSSYLSFAKDKLNQFVPIGGDVFIQSPPQYSLNNSENIFNIQCSWAYFNYVPFTSNTV